MVSGGNPVMRLVPARPATRMIGRYRNRQRVNLLLDVFIGLKTNYLHGDLPAVVMAEDEIRDKDFLAPVHDFALSNQDSLCR